MNAAISCWRAPSKVCSISFIVASMMGCPDLGNASKCCPYEEDSFIPSPSVPASSWVSPSSPILLFCLTGLLKGEDVSGCPEGHDSPVDGDGLLSERAGDAEARFPAQVSILDFSADRWGEEIRQFPWSFLFFSFAHGVGCVPLGLPLLRVCFLAVWACCEPQYAVHCGRSLLSHHHLLWLPALRPSLDPFDHQIF